MRTIKFRGKASHNGEWLYGDLINIHGEYHILGEDDMMEDGHHVTQNSDRPTWVEPDTIGQFTSLYDKNGKEIYEGDILRYPAEDKFDEENFVSFEVFWHDNDCADNHVGWQMDRHHFHGNICGARELSRFLPKYTKKMVVIGNIHDNSDLMKGGKDEDS